MREFKASKSGRKPHLSARELILKLAGFSHMVHLSFPLHTNSPALQMEKPMAPAGFLSDFLGFMAFLLALRLKATH